MLRSSDQWLAQEQFAGVEVYDPDGWNRRDFANSWAEHISEEEFVKRLCISTCKWTLDGAAMRRTKAFGW